MTINDLKFKTLVENLPSIEVPLEWDGDEGRAEIEGHEMTSGNYLVFADFNVYQSGTTDKGDYMTPPSFDSNGVNVDDISVDIFHSEMDEQIYLTESQKEEINKQIESLISTTA